MTNRTARRPLRYFRRLMPATPLLSITVFVFATLDSAVPLLYGLILKALFDTLSGAADVGWNVWTLVALYLATRVANQLAEIGSAGSSAFHFYVIDFLTAGFTMIESARGNVDSGNKILLDTLASCYGLYGVIPGGWSRIMQPAV